MLKLYVNYLGLKNTVARKVRGFAGNESGATAIEYGLIAALIAVVIIGVLSSIGTNLNTKLNSVAQSL
ncbi:MAG: Flp family type IVb pilin [Rhodospirillales bacterium]|nr:Flp family type IVb pilin [Rhodospirillales bacterium]